jgi:hypothetical protein
MKRLLALCLLGCATLAAQQIPAATELPGSPFFIKQTWVVGGVGNWDYLTMDPAAGSISPTAPRCRWWMWRRANWPG